MKKIKLILIADPQTQNLQGSNNYADPNTTVNTLSAVRNTIDPGKAKYQIPQKNLEDSPLYAQAVRFAYPDLNNKDYYPNQNDSPLLGSEQSKTLGSYPLFSGASLYPADIWAKRRNAISEYMLKLEAAKSGPVAKSPAIPFVEGGQTLGGAFNSALIDDLGEIQKHAGDNGVSAYDAIDNSANPYHSVVMQKIDKYKNLGVTAKAIESNIASVNKDFLGAGNTFSNKTAQAIQEYNQIASAPVHHQKQLSQAEETDTHNDLQSKLNELNYHITAIPNLYNVVGSAAKEIQQKSQQTIDSLGAVSGLEEWQTRGAESPYPPEVFMKDKSGNYIKDAKGNPVLDPGAKDDFLTKQAMLIAKDKQPLINNYSKDSDKEAPFSVQDIKEKLEADLGYKLTTGIHTSQEPGASANAQVSAVPQYVANKVSDLATPGKEISIKKGNSIVAGNGYTTFTENGVQTVVANSNRPELVKHLISSGAIEPSQMGAVDAASAQVNAIGNKALWKQLETIKGNTERPSVGDESNDQILNFNRRINAISGGAGISVDGSDNRVAKATIAKKGTDDFFLDINEGGSKTTGVIVPESPISSTFKEPNWKSNLASGIGLSSVAEWLKTDKNAKIASSGESAVIGDTYYHKEEPDANGVTYYTVYRKKDDKPYQVDSKENGVVVKKEIKVPSYAINNYLNKPKELLDNAKSTEQDVTSPDQTVNVSKNVATKTAKGQSATPQSNGAVTEPSDQDVANHLLSDKRFNVTDTAKALQMVQQMNNSTNPVDKNNLNIIKQRIKGK